MAQKEQTFQNHTKFDPAFHFFLAPVALIIVISTIVQMVRNPDWMGAAHILVAIWALVAVVTIRVYSLKVQDRVIRLEERLRLKELLPAPAQARIGELSVAQLVALRFASDGEVAGLAGKTLAAGLTPKQIKESIRNWRPDHFRV